MIVMDITGYTVEYNSMTVTVSESRLVVDGLLPRTIYTFSVRAQGAANSRSETSFTATPTGWCNTGLHQLLMHMCYADLGFFLNGRLLSDNSTVLLGDIGEGSGALYCLTDMFN